MRKTLAKDDNGNVFIGPEGTTVPTWNQIVYGLPAAITNVNGDLQYVPTGQMERADFRMVCAFKQLTDGTLIIKERDIIIDLGNGSQYEVLFSHDPMNTRLQIIAWLRYGTTTLEES